MRMQLYIRFSRKSIIEQKILLKYKELYIIYSFPHALDNQIFFK